MAGYFGDEPTCRRCDYPRRLHHLLGVDHDYDERSQENAPGAEATATEGKEITSNQEGNSMSNHIPSAGEIAETAFAEGYNTLTINQAVQVRHQLDNMRDSGYTRETWVELAMLGAKNMHDSNLAMIAAATVDEIGTPRGFNADDGDEWSPDQDGRITRWWSKPIGDSAASISVRVIDEITEGRIVRREPRLCVNVEGAFTASEAHDIIDDLQSALRALAETEEAQS
ncbi:hypothetical protein [Rhodococcus sp. HS-D2]|uniref:hypothetical protein n=1 Tax=Rhodococcus sp. HS-D2 TaxID=1384636 RepID=UPI0007DA2A78|nr:hypothetical protein [Rhodococcus sp. HS-D2]